MTQQIYIWRVRTRYPDRFGQECQVIVRGKRNNCVVKFLSDGMTTVTSRNYLRKKKHKINNYG